MDDGLREALAEMLVDWRQRASEFADQPGPLNATTANIIDGCADELELELTSAVGELEARTTTLRDAVEDVARAAEDFIGWEWHHTAMLASTPHEGEERYLHRDDLRASLNRARAALGSGDPERNEGGK